MRSPKLCGDIPHPGVERAKRLPVPLVPEAEEVVASTIEGERVRVAGGRVRHRIDRDLAVLRIEPSDVGIAVSGAPDELADDDVVRGRARGEFEALELSFLRLEVRHVVPRLPDEPDPPVAAGERVARPAAGPRHGPFGDDRIDVGLEARGVPGAGQRILRRIRAAVRKRRPRREPLVEQVAEEGQRVGDVELTAVVDVAGAEAAGARRPPEEVEEDGDRVGEVEPAIAVHLPADEAG